ncbi:MAG: glycosyltransferase family 2 protein [Anaerolineae bacterium]|nr:glycosyltransferase family 2 protein [Anaerolineae bacterium]MDW8098144.1 glycosyltransferase family 2 protein [Anaerolineae bacterium]
MTTPTLAAVVLTLNEEENIRACLESLAWADVCVLLDSGSQDRTVDLAEEMGAQVWTRPFDNYAAQRNAALAQIEAQWIFFVDADERATPALAEEVRRVIRDPGYVGWWVPRQNYIVGRQVRGAGWWPDYQLRLLRRGHAHYDPQRPVHEVVILDGQAGYLQNPLIHYNYRSWEQFHAKQRCYVRYEAETLRQRGIRPRPHHFVLQPWREFRRRFFTLQGYREGWWGLRLSLWLAYYYGFRPYVELSRLMKNSGSGS